MAFYRVRNFPPGQTDVQFRFVDSEFEGLSAWSNTGVTEQLDEDDEPTGSYVVEATAPSGASEIEWRLESDHDVSASASLAAPVVDFTSDDRADLQEIAARFEELPPGPAIVLPAPSAAPYTTGWIDTYQDGELTAGIVIHFVLISTTQSGSHPSSFSKTSGEDGRVTVPSLLRESTYQARRGNGPQVTFTTGNEDTYELPAILGTP